MPSQYSVCPEVAISRRIHLWEGKNASKRPCESSNSSSDRCEQEPWILVALQWRADAVTTGTFQEHICLAVGCPGRNSRRSGLGWCRRSNGERRNWLFPLGCTTVQDCSMLPMSPSSYRPGILCCNPSWHAGSWSRQHTDWGVGTSGWSLGWVASVEVCRRWWSCILRRLRTTTLPLIVLETYRPVTIPTARGQTWQCRNSCTGLTQLVRSWESLACRQLCSGSPVGRWWKPCSYRLAAQWWRSCFQWAPRCSAGVCWAVGRLRQHFCCRALRRALFDPSHPEHIQCE